MVILLYAHYVFRFLLSLLYLSFMMHYCYFYIISTSITGTISFLSLRLLTFQFPRGLLFELTNAIYVKEKKKEGHNRQLNVNSQSS